MLKNVSKNNYYNSDIFQWVDFGLHPNMYMFKKEYFDDHYFSNILYKKKIKLTGFKTIKTIETIETNFYNTHSNTVCATLFGGDLYSINKFNDLCDKEFMNMINNQMCNQEQYIYYNVMCQEPSFFDYNIIKNWDSLCKTYSENNLNIALCFSGHIRTFNECYNNIDNNIIKIIRKYNINTHLFLSTWNDNDNDINNMKYINIFNDINIENAKTEYFIENYKNDNWKKFTGLSNKFTFPNCVSMLYKIHDSFVLMKNYSSKYNIKYDIIFRLRPDICYNNKFDISLIKYSLLNDVLLFPFPHGKYSSATKNIMDHYFFGNYDTMEKIMTSYTKLNEIKSDDDVVYTGEGLLYREIIINNISLKRFKLSYYVLRKNKKEDIVI